MALIYCDSSALVKLVVAEAESDELRRWVFAQTEAVLVSSVVARTEVVRAVRRVGLEPAPAAAELLESVTMIALDADLADEAGGLAPPVHRSLDAIHLASAQRLGTALGAFVAYDERLVRAAEALSFTVVRPGTATPEEVTG